MTAPAYLANAFNFLETLTVTDVANTITRMLSQAALVGWTSGGAGNIRTPVNAAGQYIDLTFTRVSATNMQMVFLDSLSRTFTRRTQVPASFTERLYFNTQGFAFDPGNGEGLWGSILDLSPELQTAHDQWAAGFGARTAADALDGLFKTGGAEQLSSATPRVYTAVVASILHPRGGIINSGAAACCFNSKSGSRLWFPVIQQGPVTGTTKRIRGRVFQMLFVSGLEAAQTEFVVPLDGANTGTFKVLSFSSSGQTSFNGQMAMRKA
jgi:hypothetical protein